TSTAAASDTVESFAFEGGTLPIAIATADFDGDGKTDVVSAASGGATLFRNVTQSGGTLAFAAPVFLGSDISGLTVVDLNGDGATDLAAVEANYYQANGTLHTWINQSTPGTFAFGTDTTVTVPTGAFQVNVVDIDGAGAIDL